MGWDCFFSLVLQWTWMEMMLLKDLQYSEAKKESKNVKEGIVKRMLVWGGRENKIENLLETVKIIDLRLVNIFSK